MDLEPANAAPILQATLDDLERLLQQGFGTSLTLRRNYGDWLRVEASADGFRAEHHDAATGRLHDCEDLWPIEQARDAARAYFDGHWTWRQGAWRQRANAASASRLPDATD